MPTGESTIGRSTWDAEAYGEHIPFVAALGWRWWTFHMAMAIMNQDASVSDVREPPAAGTVGIAKPSKGATAFHRRVVQQFWL